MRHADGFWRRFRAALVAFAAIASALPSSAIAAPQDEPAPGAPAPRLLDPVADAPRIAVRSIETPGSASTTLLAAPGVAEAIARDFAGGLAGEREALERLIGLPDGGPVEIRVGHGREEFRALQPGTRPAPGWAAGVAYPDLGLVVLDTQASSRSGDVRSVLRHELAHVALARVVRGRIPHWLTEGFALLYADEWTLSRSTVLARASAARALIPLEEIDRSWPRSPSDVDLAYAQSASIVAYLASAEGGRPFRALIASLTRGTAMDDAVIEAYGQPLLVQEIAWKKTLRARYAWLPLFLDHELLWGWAAVVLMIGAWRVRRRTRRRIEAMEDGPDLELEATVPSSPGEDATSVSGGPVRAVGDVDDEGHGEGGGALHRPAD
ncbi:peptidase MA family metallohydrolase [Vulgatibacter incomptus]|uniref:peptidase MA family metallohydrolase n=1 Tax=Vulgatibacter incomptus TaxID=1391653 RepID=UPI0009EBEAD0|nr:peptidase MA family metallohydrolase [Vulgatibacter incomptus]